ncbi:hypothetical protein MRX96_016375 [Rhipicephalus microplus]
MVPFPNWTISFPAGQPQAISLSEKPKLNAGRAVRGDGHASEIGDIGTNSNFASELAGVANVDANSWDEGEGSLWSWDCASAATGELMHARTTESQPCMKTATDDERGRTARGP